MPLSKRSRRGVFWLLIVAGCTAVLPRILISVFSANLDETVISHQEFQVIAENFEASESERNQYQAHSYAPKFKLPPGKFDPNTYSKNDWMHLGVSEKQANVIVRFSARGLYSNEDLKRIFVLPEALYNLIKDSTVYPERPVPTHVRTTQKPVILVNINTANQEELMQIPGIGAYFAEKIVTYRQKLGGFISPQQLLEVRKFDAQKLEDIEPYINIGSGAVERINVNTADFNTLNAHPYISYEVANSIVKMRAQKAYDKIEDLKRSKLIDDELFNKIAPYLSIQ